MLLASLLFGVPKKPTGLRPITAGEVWWKVSAVLGMSPITTNPEMAMQLFAGVQLGSLHKGGVEAVIHLLQAQVDNDPTACVAAFDTRNAFNTIRRGAMLSRVLAIPLLRPIHALIAWGYRRPAPLHVVSTDATLLSTEGVRQGDPLASLAFDITTQPELVALQQTHPDCRFWAVHDDVMGGGPLRSLLVAQETLQRLLHPLQLTLRPDKTRYLVRSLAQVEVLLGRGHSRDHIFTCAIPLLGSAVGPCEAERLRMINAKVESTANRVTILTSLALPAQMKFVLITYALQMELLWQWRTNPPNLTATAALRACEIMWSVVSAIICLPMVSMDALDVTRA